jgi:hypothetical protein
VTTPEDPLDLLELGVARSLKSVVGLTSGGAAAGGPNVVDNSYQQWSDPV